ncbi:MAG: hypothetical protein ACXWWQ_05995, partial [Candidatus Limnocylindria bacterium]
FPCSGPRGCWLALDGEGLQPGSEVIVGDPAVAYGASFVVQSDGTVAVEGIFLIGTCSTRPSSDFIARGVGADGLPIESEVVTIDHTSNMCP